jgi:hypothetical protein
MRFRMMMLAMLAMTGPAAAERVQLYAAGSLRGALTEIAKAYESSTGNKVEAKYGPSGLLKTEISAGAKADVFASANMEHPQALHDEKKGGPVLRFARNKLCALVRPGLTVDSANLLERMLDPNVSWAPRHRRPIRPATMLLKFSRKPRPSGLAHKPYLRRKRYSSPAAQAARRRRRAAPSMAGMWPKAAPISS